MSVPRTVSARDVVDVGKLPAISLGELNDAAALQQRVDRKYIVTSSQFTDVVDALSHRLAVLEIGGERSFGYESTYFDTVDLQSFHAAVHRRRRRFKVRTRTYLGSGLVMLEVKTRGCRGETLKRRQTHEGMDSKSIDAGAAAFIDDALATPGIALALRPSLTTTYRRTTLLDLDGLARITIDADVRFVDRSGQSAGLPGRFVLETKSAGSPGAVDRHLWQAGIRPEKISKYGTGLAVLDPALPSNKWHRTMQRHFR